MKKIKKEVSILISSISAIIIILAGIYFFTDKKEQVSAPPPVATTYESVLLNNRPTSLIRDFSHRDGPEDAKVKVVEFYDPECEACAAFFPYVQKIKSRYKNKIQLIARYALYHSNSLLAAKASDAAALQGKFWEYQELLFLNQKQWSHQQGAATTHFINYAKDLNLNQGKFIADMNDSARMHNITIDLEDGKGLQVNGTPTFFVNNKQLEKLHPDALMEAIEKELNK
jgi:protein-disulfide isomerase